MLLYLIYRYAFGADAKRLADDTEIPNEEKYKDHVEGIHRNIQAIKDTAFEKWTITARDGTKLVGKYYHNVDRAPVVMMFHGYRSSAIRDGMGAFNACKQCGYNILMVDQRAHRESGGKCITFGVKERYDCVDWIREVCKQCGKDVKIILIGLSMGASTVLMAAGLDLPENVRGIIADCGYSSPKEILQSVIKDMKLPVRITYPFVRLSARIYGQFDPDSVNVGESLTNAKVPVLFIHGEDDHYVPCEMSRRNYEACASEKEILIVPGADHGMSYMTDTPRYVEKFKGFLQKHFEN